MKDLKYIMLFLVIIITSCANNNDVIVMSSEAKESAKLTTINFKIEGLVCKENKGEVLASKIVDMKGVSNVKLNCSDGETYVTYDVDLTNPDSISNIIKELDTSLKINHLHTETDN